MTRAVTKVLRWAAAIVVTWFLAATVLAALVKGLGVGSIGFSIALNMVLPMWVFAFFAVADPNIDHPWLEPYLQSEKLGA